MAGRPRRDGTPARAVNKRKLTDLFVSTQKAGDRDELIWDLKQPGLALSVRTTGKKAWKVIYRFHGRPRWLHLGDVRSIGLADARRLTAKIVLDVIEGKDPAAERQAERLTGTFADLASQYVELHAKKHNKSWKQAERLVARHLLPRWGKLKANAITRADVRADDDPDRRADCRQPDLAAASAIFSWAIRQEILTVNPCKGRPQSDHGSRARAVRRRDRSSVREARSGAEADPADRPAARRSRRHASRAHRRRLVADAGQAARRLAGHQERQGSPGRAVGAGAGADREPPRDEAQRQRVEHCC